MIHLKINKRIYEKLFDQAIRSRFDSIRILINTYDYLINYSKIEFEDSTDVFEIFIKNINGYRIFYYKIDQIYTLCSPFRINVDGRDITLYHNLIGEISNKEISLLKRIFKNESIYLIQDAVNSYCELENIISEDFSDSGFTSEAIWQLIINIVHYESGYIRYDFDPNNENSEKIHPLHHLDLSYSNYSTYKFGLYESISIEDFINIFDSSTDQLFLSAYNSR